MLRRAAQALKADDSLKHSCTWDTKPAERNLTADCLRVCTDERKFVQTAANTAEEAVAFADAGGGETAKILSPEYGVFLKALS